MSRSLRFLSGLSQLRLFSPRKMASRNAQLARIESLLDEHAHWDEASRRAGPVSGVMDVVKAMSDPTFHDRVHDEFRERGYKLMKPGNITLRGLYEGYKIANDVAKGRTKNPASLRQYNHDVPASHSTYPQSYGSQFPSHTEPYAHTQIHPAAHSPPVHYTYSQHEAHPNAPGYYPIQHAPGSIHHAHPAYAHPAYAHPGQHFAPPAYAHGVVHPAHFGSVHPGMHATNPAQYSVHPVQHTSHAPATQNRPVLINASKYIGAQAHGARPGA